MKAIIIGSGVSGLTAAALLAKGGYNVKLFEQHENIGGITSTIEKDGFKWDWGQMLIPELGDGEPARKILENLSISDKVNVVKGYRENFFRDFRIQRPKEYRGITWRKEYLKLLFPEDSKGIDNYYKIYERIHDISALSKKSSILAKLKLLFSFLPMMRKKNWSAQQLMEYCFKSEKLRAVYTAILADYVASPKVFPGLILPLINSESQYDERIPFQYDKHQPRQSWHFVKGGCISLVNALSDAIIKNEGEIITKTAITKINISNNKITGVITDKGDTYDADLIIASGGARELFLNLIGKEYLPEEYIKTYIERLFTTESVFMVHLGVDYDPSVHQNGAALCYYYLTYNIDVSIEECQKRIYHEGKDGFLAYIPSVYSSDMAPEGHHAITIYTIAPDQPINGDWDEKKEDWAEKLLDIAEKHLPGLREHEKIRVILTPNDFKKRTYLTHHAFGGTVPHLKIPPPPHETPIKGLWFIGAQSETYGGVTGVMIGAENVVNRIIKTTKSKRNKPTINVS